MVKIKSVTENTPAFSCGLRNGDVLVSINGSEINDVLDYRFYTVNKKLNVVYLRDGVEKSAVINKREYDDFGAEFETFLIDNKKRCTNNCLFCFIDQNPKGMRESIYFKDDDERLGFLHGNYITLTNLKDSDIERIIKMHISPINVSVHTYSEELRNYMLGNRFAGQKLKYLEMLSAHGITINAQIVVCPGINDGDELRNTLEKLALLESVDSIAVVPVGLTAHRDGLAEIKPFDKDTAKAVIDIVEAFGEKMLDERNYRLAYAADELYITAGLEIPPEEYYESYPQIDNGVGMLRNLDTEFTDELEYGCFEIPADKRSVTVATGAAAYDHILSLMKKFEERFPNVSVQTVCVKNLFFGESVTVSGLLTGSDLLRELSGKELGDALLIPVNMLRHERDLFLDGISVDELSEKLGVKIRIVENSGASLLENLLAAE